MSILNVTFPVFRLVSYKKLWEKNNIIYIRSYSGKINTVDNRNLGSIGFRSRRLLIPKEERHPINKTFFSLVQLVKGHVSSATYVDNTGKLFKYTKTKYVPLKYHKIKSKKYVESLGIVISVKGINATFLATPDQASNTYVGLLEVDRGYLLFDFSSEYKKPTKRKI